LHMFDIEFNRHAISPSVATQANDVAPVPS